MKIDKLNCCVKSILSIFHGLNDLARVRKKLIYEYVTTDYTHNFLSKTLHFKHNDKNGSVLKQFSQASITRNTSLGNRDFLA